MDIVLLEPLNFDLNVRPASKEVSMVDSYILEFDITNVSAVFFFNFDKLFITF